MMWLHSTTLPLIPLYYNYCPLRKTDDPTGVKVEIIPGPDIGQELTQVGEDGEQKVSQHYIIFMLTYAWPSN